MVEPGGDHVQIGDGRHRATIPRCVSCSPAEPATSAPSSPRAWRGAGTPSPAPPGRPQPRPRCGHAGTRPSASTCTIPTAWPGRHRAATLSSTRRPHRTRTWGPAEQAAVRAILTALRGSGAPFISTSGVWVYGSAPPGRLLDEDSPTDPVATFAWRPAAGVRGRRGGRGRRADGGHPPGHGLRPRRRPAEPVRRHGRRGRPSLRRRRGTNHWTLVHVDDLAELYALALERAPAGTLVNGVVGPPLRVKDMAEAAAAGAGFAAPPGPGRWPRPPPSSARRTPTG